MPPLVASLSYHPVKSMAGIPVDQATLDRRGLRNDRRWMVARAKDGRFVSQRSHPQLAAFTPRLIFDEALELTAPDGDVLRLSAVDGGPRRTVSVWKHSEIQAVDEGDEAAAWLSERLGWEVRLVRIADDYVRPANPRYAPGREFALADAFPVKLHRDASVEVLERRAEPFRKPPMPDG